MEAGSCECEDTTPAAPPNYLVRELPLEMKRALYNLDALGAAPNGTQTPRRPRGGAEKLGAVAVDSSRSDSDLRVPGPQVVFYAFNYGSAGAVSFASGLPPLCLERAASLRGWRPKSRALLRAVMSYRGLQSG